MKGYRYLFKNIGLLSLSQFGTKILAFLLVPLYTSVLTTKDYGIYDLCNTTISLLIPILTFNIADATLRYAIDQNSDKESVWRVSWHYYCISLLFMALFTGVNGFWGIFPEMKEYSLLMFLLYATTCLNGIISNFCRGIDKIKDIAISGVISSAVIILMNIIFLLITKWGIIGYFLAYILGALSQVAYLSIAVRIWRYMSIKPIDAKLSEDMTEFSKPMIANSVAWWINSVSDRYVITFFCGLAENGIYSVAGKIPSILNIFQTIFNQAWTLSAVKDFDPEDKEGFFSNTYKAYNCIMVVICSCVIAFDKILARFLYAKDFYIAWRYVPWLTMAILFGSLSGYIGGFFTAVKDSKQFSRSSLIGAITNIVLNLAFTPFLGAMGAAVATVISYAEVWIVRYINSRHYVRFDINIKRDIISYLILLIQSLALLFLDVKWQISITVIIVILYKKDIKQVVKHVLKK